MSRPQQSFIVDQRDLTRARTAALTSGLSLNAWMRRAMRTALDGEASNVASAAPTPLDTSALDDVARQFAALAGRIEADHARHAEGLSGGLEALSKAGRGLAAIEQRLAGVRPVQPAQATQPVRA